MVRRLTQALLKRFRLCSGLLRLAHPRLRLKQQLLRLQIRTEPAKGKINPESPGIPRLRPKCNERSCHLESQPLMYITYFFPTWCPARMISLMISITPLAGPVISLKTQRTVSADSDIFVCAKTGNIDRMKYLFENGLASPHDVSISSGITALHVGSLYFNFVTIELNSSTVCYQLPANRDMHSSIKGKCRSVSGRSL
jgi:hypothetical protein